MKVQMLFIALLLPICGTVIPGCDIGKDDTNIDANNPQDDERPAIPEEAPYAKAVVDQLEYNFGVMEVGQEDRHTFVLTNKSTERDLIIKKGPTTCKCTISSLDQDSLKPGESTEIELIWTPKAVIPVFEQTAEIWTSDPENKTILLKIAGNVQEAISLSPRNQWSVGSLEGDKPQTISGVISSQVYDNLEIINIENTSDIVSVKKQKLEKSELDEKFLKVGYRITATVTPKNKVGRFNEKFVIQTRIIDPKTKKEKIAKFPVQIVGSRVGPVIFRAMPGVKWSSLAMTLRLGRFKASEGKSAVLNLFVAESKEGPLKVNKVSSHPTFLTATLKRMGGIKESKEPIEPGRRVQYQLTFSVPAGSPPASHELKKRATITLETNHPKAKTMKFSVDFLSN
jgi:hypothetical protein